MPLRTRVTDMLGIEHPVVMGGLTGVGTVELAAAVSNAGGLGMFTSHNAVSHIAHMLLHAHAPPTRGPGHPSGSLLKATLDWILHVGSHV